MKFVLRCEGCQADSHYLLDLNVNDVRLPDPPHVVNKIFKFGKQKILLAVI